MLSTRMATDPSTFLLETTMMRVRTVGCLPLHFGAQLYRPNNAEKTAMDVRVERNENEDDEETARLRHRLDWS